MSNILLQQRQYIKFVLKAFSVRIIMISCHQKTQIMTLVSCIECRIRFLYFQIPFWKRNKRRLLTEAKWEEMKVQLGHFFLFCVIKLFSSIFPFYSGPTLGEKACSSARKFQIQISQEIMCFNLPGIFAQLSE